MKKIFLLIILAYLFGCSNSTDSTSEPTVFMKKSTSSIPEELVGVWATQASEFANGTLVKGNSIYIESDGNGGTIDITSDGHILAMPFVITSYNTKTNVFSMNVMVSSNNVKSVLISYDPSKRAIIPPNPSRSDELYLRRQDKVTTKIKNMVSKYRY